MERGRRETKSNSLFSFPCFSSIFFSSSSSIFFFSFFHFPFFFFYSFSFLFLLLLLLLLFRIVFLSNFFPPEKKFLLSLSGLQFLSLRGGFSLNSLFLFFFLFFFLSFFLFFFFSYSFLLLFFSFFHSMVCCCNKNKSEEGTCGQVTMFSLFTHSLPLFLSSLSLSLMKRKIE